MTKPPPTNDEDGFARLAARLAKATKRAPFAAWLSQGKNFQRLKTQIDQYGARWDEIAAWAIEEGITGDKPLTGVAAKRAYEREADRRGKAEKSVPAKTAQSRLNAPEPATPAAPAKTADQPAHTPSDPKEAARARLRAQMKPITIRKRE